MALLSPFWFRVVVFLVVCSPLTLHTWYTHLVHSVTWSFYFEYVLFSFLMSTFYIFCVDVCYAFDMRHIFTLASLITWTWPIMEDIEPIDLGSGDWPREFETVTHFTSVRSSTISISIPRLYGLGDLPILSLTWYHPLVPLHDFTTLVHLIMLQYHCLSFPSFPWFD